jgi:hypothetical protein
LFSLFFTGNHTDSPFFDDSNFFSSWVIATYPPSFAHIARSLAGYTGVPFLLARWSVLACGLVAFLLGLLLSPAPAQSADPAGLIGVALSQVCDGPVNSDAFVDPVSGFTTVILAAAAYLATAAAVHWVKERQDVLLCFLGRAQRQGGATIDETEQEANAQFEKARKKHGIKSFAHKVNRSFFLAVHVLIVSFVIGYGLRSGPSGGAVCQAANVIFIIFQKAFIPSLLYLISFMTDTEQLSQPVAFKDIVKLCGISAEELKEFKTLFPPGSTDSALSRNLTESIWNEYKDKKDDAGVSFKTCVFSGVKNLDSGIGLYAGDHSSYKVFNKLFDKVI